LEELIRIMVEADLKRVEDQIQSGMHRRGHQEPVIISPHRE